MIETIINGNTQHFQAFRISEGNGVGKKADYHLKLRYSSVLEAATQPSHNPRIWYATPYGEIHFKMPSIEHIENEERIRWNWYAIKIRPSYER